MQKEIQLTDKTLLVVGLPKEANRFKMFPDIGSQPYLSYFKGVDTHREYVDVGFELIGVYPELTEEQLKPIMPTFGSGYQNLNPHPVNCDLLVFKTALESFQSLMEREKLFTENPYDYQLQSTEENYLRYKCDKTELQTVEDMFNEAQQRTFDKFAVLTQKSK